MKITLLSIFVMISFVVKSQELTVFYKEKRKPSQVLKRNRSTNPVPLVDMAEVTAIVSKMKDRDSIRMYIKKIGDSIQKLAKEENEQVQNPLIIPEYDFITILKIDHKKSLYYPQEKVSNDTLIKQTTNEKGRSFKNEKINYHDSEIIYKDFSENKTISSIKIHSFDMRGRNFLIEEELVSQEWDLTKETKQIDKYLCYKAILKNSDKEVEAWYTKEININNGPKSYHGLPGLILELKEGKKVIYFSKIALLSVETMNIKPPTEGERITRQELKELPSKIFNNW